MSLLQYRQCPAPLEEQLHLQTHAPPYNTEEVSLPFKVCDY